MLKIGKLGFDGNNLPTGVWGEFSDGVKIKVRRLTAEVIRELRRPHVTTSMVPHEGRMVQSEKLDPEKYDEAIMDYLIEDFEGIGDENGNPLPKTLESKKRILNEISIKDWVWAFAQSIQTVQETVEKN